MVIDSKKTVKVKGVVLETLPGTKFKVGINIKGKEHVIYAYISGKMRMNFIKILPGDKVRVEMTPYDKEKGRIIYRY
ncbi:MAG: translation initiation factor IF-1 [Parachlamydiaceae bacterium]